MTDRGDLYNKIGIGLLIGLGLVYFPIKFVALALMIMGGLFCLAWLVLIMPDEVAGGYDSHFEPPPWVDRWEEYRTTSDNLEPEPEVKKPDNPGQPGKDKFTGQADEEAQVFEWGDWSTHKQ